MPSSHSHCFQHCNTVTMCFRPLSQVDRPRCVFVSTKNSRPLPPLTHTDTLSAWKTNTFMSYCICKTESPPIIQTPPQIFTVDSQVLVQSSWRWLTSVFPFDTCQEWKTRQTSFPSSISEAACSYGDTETHTRKTPFNNLICCIFHGSRRTYSALCQMALFFSTTIQPATPHTVRVCAKPA